MDMADMHLPFMSSDDMELLTSPSARPGAPHRRVRSDPSDIMQALRAERSQWGGLESVAPAPKRDLSPMMESSGFSPAFKKHAPSTASHPDDVPVHGMLAFPSHSNLFSAPALEVDLTAAGGDDAGGDADSADGTGKVGSKKDVPMWTVEEDLLILQLVEKHGKRWSKIAAHLPGRTDNGVRNRWNRMERAQVLRQRRGPEAGYRCRRCGQPKRGHICAALTLGDTPAGEELQQKAEALSKLSANRMRPPSATSEVSEAPPASAQSTPSLAPERAPSPELPLLKWGAPGVIKPAADALATASAAPADSTSVTGLPQMVYQEAPMDAEMIKGELGSAPAAADERGSMFGSMFDDFQLDDFLDELQLEFVKPPQQQPVVTAGAPAPALLSQASLQSLLMTLSSNETSFASVASQLNQPAMPVFC